MVLELKEFIEDCKNGNFMIVRTATSSTTMALATTATQELYTKTTMNFVSIRLRLLVASSNMSTSTSIGITANEKSPEIAFTICFDFLIL